MRLRPTTRLRLWRRPVVTLAAALMVAQAFLAGLAGVQAAVFGLAGIGDFAVICHGQGDAGSDHGSAPSPGRDQHPCCIACRAGAPPALLPLPSVALRIEVARLVPIRHAVAIPIPVRAVRAGQSQAPPSLA